MAILLAKPNCPHLTSMIDLRKAMRSELEASATTEMAPPVLSGNLLLTSLRARLTNDI